MNEKTGVAVSAVLTEELVRVLDELADQRGVTANTVLQQAIETERYFADQRAAGGKVLIEKPDQSFRLVHFHD